MNNYKATTLVIMLALGTGLLPIHADAETFTFRDSTTFDVGAMPDVTLESISGDVGYEGIEGTSATVEIVVQIRAEDSAEAEVIREHLQLIVEGEEGRLFAAIEKPIQFYRWLRREYRRGRDVHVSFLAQGPKGAEVRLESVSGNVDANNLDGAVEANSVSGNVDVADMRGTTRVSSVSGSLDVRGAATSLEANTVSGDIGIDDCGADVTIESVSGEILARRVVGPIRGETVSGNVELRSVGSTVTFETVSGDIWIEQDGGGFDLSTTSGNVIIKSGGDGNMEVSTVNGDVTLAVDPAKIGEVVLESPSGEMGLDLPVKLRRHSQDRLMGRLGDGDAYLEVHTSSGNITITQL